MFTPLRQRFRNWLFRPRVEHGTIVLKQRRIFILPTKQGLALGLLLILMLAGDINYGLSLGYVLTFMLAMMAFMSMLHAFRNLAHLKVSAGRMQAVFSGEVAQFLLHFSSDLPRFELCLRDQDDNRICFDLPAGESTEIFFPLPASKRGWLQTGRLELYTEFPLGLFHAWAYLHFDARCLVYPKPLSEAPLPLGNTPDGTGKRDMSGDDDFAGLRNYVPGDALPRLAWKAYARGHALQVKQFSTPAGDTLWLDLSDAPDPDMEEKLARMTRWVLDAEAKGLRYGLKLPDSELPLNSGTDHRDTCLRRIALCGLT